MVAWRNSVLLKIRVLSQANIHRWIQMSFRSFLPVVISIVCDAEHQRITITTFWNNFGKTLSEVIIFHATIGIILYHNFIITVYLKCFTLVFTNHSYGLSFTPFVRTSWSYKTANALLIIPGVLYPRFCSVLLVELWVSLFCFVTPWSARFILSYRCFSEYSSAQNVIMTHMIIKKKSTTMFLEKVIFLIAYHLCLTFMFSSMKSFLYTKNVGKHPNIASQ